MRWKNSEVTIGQPEVKQANYLWLQLTTRLPLQGKVHPAFKTPTNVSSSDKHESCCSPMFDCCTHVGKSSDRILKDNAVNRPKVEKEEFVCPTVWSAQESCEQSIYCCIGQNLLSSNTWVPTYTSTQMLNISIKKVYESAKFRRNWLI